MGKMAELESMYAELAPPKTLGEWEAYIHSLSGQGLRSNVINANKQRFVNLLLTEGYELAEIEDIMRAFVRRMAALEMKLPEGGSFDLMALYEEDPVARTFSREPLRQATEKPLTPNEQKDLARANMFVMDWEVDGGNFPREINKLVNTRRRLTPNESRVILDWFYRTAPGDFF